MWQGTSRQIGDSSELQQLDREFTDGGIFKSAESLRVRLRGAMILEDKDRGPFRRDNDLMIMTTYSFGDDPLVDRIHLIEENVKLGWQGDFFDDVILSKQDLEDENLTLRVRIYDLDGIDEELMTSVRNFATTAAVTFPVLAPYAGLMGLSVMPILQFIDMADNHDQILDETITLETDEPKTGHKLLQRGYFALFNKDSIEEDLSIRNDLRVERTGNGEYQDGSYVIIEIDDSYEMQREREIDQKVAKLASELGGKGRSVNPALFFLRDTLSIYTKFTKLKRVTELQS